MFIDFLADWDFWLIALAFAWLSGLCLYLVLWLLWVWTGPEDDMAHRRN